MTSNTLICIIVINSYLKKRLNLYEIEIEMTFLLGTIKFQFEIFFVEILNTEYIKKRRKLLEIDRIKIKLFFLNHFQNLLNPIFFIGKVIFWRNSYYFIRQFIVFGHGTI